MVFCFFWIFFRVCNSLYKKSFDDNNMHVWMAGGWKIWMYSFICGGGAGSLWLSAAGALSSSSWWSSDFCEMRWVESKRSRKVLKPYLLLHHHHTWNSWWWNENDDYYYDESRGGAVAFAWLSSYSSSFAFSFSFRAPCLLVRFFDVCMFFILTRVVCVCVLCDDEIWHSSLKYDDTHIFRKKH